VMERRPGEYQLVDETDCDAAWGAVPECPECPVAAGTVEVEDLPLPGVDRRDDEGLPVVDEADMADQGLVQDRVDDVSVVAAATRLAEDPGPLGLFVLGGHSPMVGTTPITALTNSRAAIRHSGVLQAAIQLSSNLRITASESRIASATVS
jgi:hypothetical protein